MTADEVHVSVDRLGDATAARIREIIDGAVPQVAPALALSVWQSGGCWFDARAGDATIFDVASLTKLFTTTAFLRLAAYGRVGLDDPLVTVIPEFGEGGPRGVDGGQEPLTRSMRPVPPARAGWTVDPTEVTFRQLLTHTSGMAPWRSVFLACGPAPAPPGEPDAVSVEQRHTAGLAAIFSYPFVSRPGEEVHYSDLGFITLGEAVARLAGTTLDGAIRTLIVDRLALETVGYRPVESGVPLDRIVPTSEDSDWRQRRIWGEVEDENAAGLGGVAGHAGLFADAQDIARFGVAWMQRDPRLRFTQLADAATTDQTPRDRASRGLGWRVQDHPLLAAFGPRAYGHTGFTGTSIVVDPDRDLVIALLTNRVYAGRTHEGIEGLRQAMHEALAAAF